MDILNLKAVKSYNPNNATQIDLSKKIKISSTSKLHRQTIPITN